MALLQEVTDLMRAQMEKSNITLTIAASTDTTVRGDPDQLKQVLLNLVRNAAESIGECGRITLHLRTERTTGGRSAFSNMGVVYQGSSDDEELNRTVARFAAVLAQTSEPQQRCDLRARAARDVFFEPRIDAHAIQLDACGRMAEKRRRITSGSRGFAQRSVNQAVIVVDGLVYAVTLPGDHISIPRILGIERVEIC